MSNFDRQFFEPIHENVCHLAAEVFHEINEEWISECKTLCKILDSVHMRALFYTVECVVKQNYLPYYPDLDEELTQSSFKSSEFDANAVKIVQVVKNLEPLGATVKVDDVTGAIVIARILHGGAAYRSGLIHVGDVMFEVNGIPVRGRSAPEVIELLKNECQNSTVSFKLLPAGCDMFGNTWREARLVVKALFDYNPEDDPYLPCVEAGLPFNKGNILHVVNQDDPNWWQARKVVDDKVSKSLYSLPRAGLIPGKNLQERRLVALRDLKSCYDSDRYIEVWPGCKSPFTKKRWAVRKVKKVMYDITENVEFDKEQIATYEPVAKMYPKRGVFRPIILIGTPTIVEILIRRLLQYNPDRYKQPIAHTSRIKRRYEAGGREYIFTSQEWMQMQLQTGNFLEFGEFEDNFYGIHVDTVLALINGSYVCVMNPIPEALKYIYTPEIKPYIIFVKPPYKIRDIEGKMRDKTKQFTPNLSEQEFHDMICAAHKLQYLYGHYFDTTIVHEDFNSTFIELISVLQSVENEPQWVPVSWISKAS